MRCILRKRALKIKYDILIIRKTEYYLNIILKLHYGIIL